MKAPEEIREALRRGEDPKALAQRVKEGWEGDLEALEGLLEGLLQEPSREVALLLLELTSLYDDKKVVKALRRALFKLRQKGIVVEEERRGRSVLRPLRLPEPRGYLGAIDARGLRFVAIERPGARGGVLGYVGLGGAEEGLKDLFRLETSTKAWRNFLEQEVSSPNFPLVEAPAAYCWHLLRRFAERRREMGDVLPAEYTSALQELGGLRWDGAVPLVYQFIRREEVADRASLLRASEGLLEVPPFSLWVLGREEVEPYAKAMREAEESLLALTEAQKAERKEGIVLKALQELFPEERRLAYKERLEEMAYLLWKRGDLERAKVALAAALDLERPLSSFDPNPFLKGLTYRSIVLALEDFYRHREDEKASSLLVPP